MKGEPYIELKSATLPSGAPSALALLLTEFLASTYSALPVHVSAPTPAAQSTQSRAARARRGNDVVFIGHELTRYSREFLINGVMDAVIDQVPRKQARMLIDMLESFARGENGAFNPETAPISVYFRENLP